MLFGFYHYGVQILRSLLGEFFSFFFFFSWNSLCKDTAQIPSERWDPFGSMSSCMCSTNGKEKWRKIAQSYVSDFQSLQNGNGPWSLVDPGKKVGW
jgi:hypothetical protein